jgi:hypothetical protein
MTHFQKTAHFNKLMGKTKESATFEMIESQIDLIHEECDETLEAIHDNDLQEMRDGFCDMYVTVAGLMVLIGHEPKQAPTYKTMSAEQFAKDLPKWLDDGDWIEFLAHIEASARSLGFDFDADMDAVNASNMSKFCHTEAQARETVKFFNRIGVSTELRHIDGFIAVVSAEDQPNFPAGKLLKSVNYQPPIFV